MLRTHGYCLAPSKPETSTSSEVSRGSGLREGKPARPHPGSSQERQPSFPQPGLPRPHLPASLAVGFLLSTAWRWRMGDRRGVPESKSQYVPAKLCFPDVRTHQAKHTALVPPRDTDLGDGAEGRPQNGVTLLHLLLWNLHSPLNESLWWPCKAAHCISISQMRLVSPDRVSQRPSDLPHTCCVTENMSSNCSRLQFLLWDH